MCVCVSGAAAGFQPQALLGAFVPLHWVNLNGSADIEYTPIQAYTLNDSQRKYFNSAAVIHSGSTHII